MGTEIVLSPAPELLPAPLFAPTAEAAKRTVEYFTMQISKDNTRIAYANATRCFAQWCASRGITERNAARSHSWTDRHSRKTSEHAFSRSARRARR
jgi:hypothetical protein